MTQLQHLSPPTTAKESFLARFLDPVDRLVEGIYSVLIVLTFTLAFDVYQAQTSAGKSFMSAVVLQLFLASLGCAVAWGLIDGVMYVLTSMFQRGEKHRLAVAVRGATDEEAAVALLAAQLDDTYADIASEQERAAYYRSLYTKLQSTVPHSVGFKKEDFAGALGVLLVAVLAALPVVLPLLLASVNSTLALRLSNFAAVAMLYWMGHSWGRHVGSVPWKIGLGLLLIGVVMVSVAIPLGG